MSPKPIKRRFFAMLTIGLVATFIVFAAATAPPAKAQEPSCSSTVATTATLTKVDAPDPVAPGGTITYTITLNPGTPTGSFGSLIDMVPLQTTFDSWIGPSGWFTTQPQQGQPGFIVSTAEAFSGTQTFVLVVTVDPTATGVITNTITISFEDENGVFVACTATATTVVSTATLCPPNDDEDNDGLIDSRESLFSTLLGNADSDLDGINDGNDDANRNGEDDEDEDDGDDCPDEDEDDDGEDDEDEDDDD
jgi:hypothetical protein